AAIDENAVDDDRARAAFAFAASFFGPGQLQVFAQHIEQSRHRFRVDARARAVHRHSDFRAHDALVIASITTSGVAGMRVIRAPTASSIAFKIAGAGPSIGTSPIPFAPEGPPSYGTSSKKTRIGGTSAAVGMM